VAGGWRSLSPAFRLQIPPHHPDLVPHHLRKSSLSPFFLSISIQHLLAGLAIPMVHPIIGALSIISRDLNRSMRSGLKDPPLDTKRLSR
jgi:hypothetical protein